MQPDSPTTTAVPARAGDQDADPYLVASPEGVRRLLQVLIEQRALVTAHVAGSDHAFPTSVLELGEGADWLLLDGGPNEAVNRIAERAPQLRCVGQIDGVQVRFHVTRHQRVVAEGYPAFRAPFPASFHYLQRRELYRLQVPSGNAPVCVMPLPAGSHDLRVLDISGGGVALAVPPGLAGLEPQQRVAGCELRLPGVDPLAIALTVRSVAPQLLANGVQVLRVGLSFDALSTQAEAAVQRYIFTIERQRSARLRGAG